MSKVAIVGGGYWGVGIALVLERKGHEVVIIDRADADAASVNSSGYFSYGWYKGEWSRHANEAATTAQLFGIPLTHSRAAHNTPQLRKTKGPHAVRIKDDWYTWRPADFLSKRPADVNESVVRVRRGEVDTKSGVVKCDVVVIAAGAWTDSLLRASGLPPIGVTGLRGTGVIFTGATTRREVFLHGLNPFLQYAIREWGDGRIRVGETVEKSGTTAAHVAKMLARVAPHIEGRDRVEQLSGLRPVARGGMQVKQVADGVIAATGGGRIGGMMGFWAGREVARLLEVT